MPTYDADIVVSIIPNVEGALATNLVDGTTAQLVGAVVQEGGLFGHKFYGDGTNDLIVYDDEAGVFDPEFSDPSTIVIIVDKAFEKDKPMIGRIQDNGQRGWEFSLTYWNLPTIKMVNAWAGNALSIRAHENNRGANDLPNEPFDANVMIWTWDGANAADHEIYMNGRQLTKNATVTTLSNTIKFAGSKIYFYTRSPTWGNYSQGYIHGVFLYNKKFTKGEAEDFYRRIAKRFPEARD